MNLQELIQQKKECAERRKALIAVAEGPNARTMTMTERLEHNAAFAHEMDLDTQIAERESQNTLSAMVRDNGGIPPWIHSPNAAASNPVFGNGAQPVRDSRLRLSADYRDAFYTYLGSNGTKVSAALYEGSNPAGGFAVPITVEGQVVPLAPPDTGLRSIATVIATANDVKIPRATTISTATGKAEGDGTGSNLFQESEPVLDQFTLSAFMAGVLHQISWELAADVPAFQQFAVGDMLLAQQLYEENLFVNGTGTGQAQGIKGNVGTGTGVAVVAGTDNYASELLDATFDVMGTLKGAYHAGASWLMARSTGIYLRKAQKQANLFAPVFSSVNGKDYLHGFPVTYSTSVDAVAAGKTPVYFGDFKQGYVIGDRGGAGVNVKILDQPKALEGILQLLCYRRTDGRVRRSEAIQSITLHS
ncbi:MAG TPA: phage major capsid protein [Terracidiphilus sp.]|nr:phage major capsid protein [Terracidiphilus sp.]